MNGSVVARIRICAFLLAVVLTALPGYSEDTPEIVALRAKAEGGDASAQYDMGFRCAKGEGTTKDPKEARKWFRKAAEQGHPGAQTRVGSLYEWGSNDNPKDEEKAVEWYTKAAEKGYAEAQFKLGTHYSWGKDQDPVKSISWYRKAADQGYADAQICLGSCYAIGEGVQKDLKKAVEWYSKAAKQNSASGQHSLGDCYAKGEGVPIDVKKAVEWYTKAAEQGHAPAQDALGNCYATGEGVSKNSKTAFEWYVKAAENEDAWSNAIFKVGLCYAEGEGVAEDMKQAKEWWGKIPERDNERKRFAKEIEQGDANAQCLLGQLCADGVGGMPKDMNRAAKWYRKAAEQGNADAQFRLGFRYMLGDGVPRDAKQAAEWYRKAADQGDACAQNALGTSCTSGEAVKWYCRAAEQGNVDAQYNLGLCYVEGSGVPKNLVQAYVWFNLAAAQDDEFAKAKLRIIEQQMTPDQIAQAQRLSAAFVPKSAAKGKNLPSTANPRSPAPDKLAGSGTGFFVTKDGWLVTNAHVATAGKKAMVKLGDTLYPAAVKLVDAANDLALIKVEDEWVDVPLLGNEGTAKDPAQSKTEGQFSALALERAGGVTLGASVFTVGFPNPGLQGYSPKMTKGEISSLAGSKDDPRYFQISAPIQPGNSGGALADESGNVVGVVSAMISDKAAIETTGAIPQNVNYAVKSTYLLALVESIPDAAKGLKEPVKTQDFSAAVQAVEKASAMVLMFE